MEHEVYALQQSEYNNITHATSRYKVEDHSYFGLDSRRMPQSVPDIVF